MNPDKNPDLVHAIVHVAADHLLSKSEGKAQVNSADLQKRAEEFVGELDPVQQQKLLSNLRIYEMTIGKDFGRELSVGQTETSAIVRDIRGEVRRFAEEFLRQDGDPHSLIQETRGRVQDLLGAKASGTESIPDPSALYEEVIANDSAAFALAKDILGKTNAKKWNELLDLFLTQPVKAEKFVKNVGFVPSRFYTGKAFKDLIQPPDAKNSGKQQKVRFSHLAALHHQWKTAEEKESAEGRTDGVLRGRLLRARAQILQQIFLHEEDGALNEYSDKAGGGVTVDINGLWIKLEVRREKKTHSLDAHLPYAYASDEVLAAMKKNGWITDFDVTEARLRRAEAQNDVLLKEECEKEKLIQFMLATGKFSPEECSEKTTEELEEILEKKLLWFDWKVNTDNASSIVHCPIPTLLRFVAKGHYPERAKDRGQLVAGGIAYAQAIQSALSGENAKEYDSVHNLYGRLIKKSGDRHDVNRDVLQDPRNYDAVRIAGAVLDALPDFPKEGIRHSIFRGPMEKKEDGTEKPSFLAAANEYGTFAKIQLFPGKQLSKNQREIFESLPELSKSDTELYETLVRSHSYARLSASGLREMAGARGSDLPGDAQEEAIEYYTQKMNLFLCMEFPEKYKEALEMRAGALRHNMRSYNWPTWDYETLCADAIKEFAEKIFVPNPRSIIKNTEVQISRKQVQFDENFMQSCAKELEDRWSLELSRQLQEEKQSINVVYGEKEKQHISFALEAKAIRALGVQLDRPLIQVIGGCRYIADGGAGGSLPETLSQNIVTAADKLKANVVPPGTQSGMGIAMSKAAQAYRKKTDGVPVQDAAQFFAVSPGGQTYFPGNHLLGKDPETLAYAIAPFNTLLTPFQGWSQKEKREFLHFKYAEAIYHRVSAGQPRITVVGNGGLLTVVESIAALENDADMILVRDTGRFADLAIALRDIPYQGELPVQDWEKAVIQLIQTKVSAHSRDSLLREFGEKIPAENPAQETYREQVHHFSHLMQSRKNIIVSDAHSLGSSIEKLAEESRSNMR